MSTSPSTVEGIADAIVRPSRRTVARTAGWSLPAIAVGIAAPARAASPGFCPTCGPDRPACIIGETGTCRCGPGLVCVGSGPLGLANVCVGADLAALVATCGGTTCTGVCLDPGGGVVTAFNTLAAAMTTFVTGVQALGLVGTRTCSHQPGLPTNVCASPFNDGGLGSICVEQFSCGNTALLGTLVTTLDAAIATFVTTLSGMGIAVSSACQAPYVCKDGASVAMDTGTAVAQYRRVGICQCGPQDTCPDRAGFAAAC